MKTYVIIPQFLVTEELVELARNAIKSFRDSADVYIISVDDAGEYKKAKGAREVMNLSDMVIVNSKNKGFAATCNAGFNVVLTDKTIDNCYIICANNDIIVNKRTVPELQRPFEMFDNVAISGILSTKEMMWEGLPLEEVDTGRISEGGLIGDRMQDGGLWCSTKNILQKIGTFDEIFLRGGYEDIELFLRARDTFGMKLIMSGRAAYWHKQGATRWNTEKIGAVNNFGLESKRIEDQNLEKFIDKWGYNPHQRQIWFENIIWNS
jgi:GT2 family glycosyltransferase